MCGIAGFVSGSPLKSTESRTALERMLEAIAHRGPDDRGILIDDVVALGHNRLSIIDLSPDGRQPMGGEDGRVQVVFNGEIYNFLKLRNDLVEAGHHFISRTDTEVLVHGYEEWGFLGLLNRIEGMFAFAVWDGQTRKLYLARDRFGIKPLYFYQRNERLIFASELKAILAYCSEPLSVDGAGLLLSMQHIGIPDPYTLYQGVRQLRASEWLSFSCRDGAIESGIYWDWRPNQDLLDQETSSKLLWERICASVEMQLCADVPVGVFLSGGLDSSLVAVACAELGRKPTCLTIALDDERNDESPYAAQLCKRYGLPHWIEPMKVDDAEPFDRRLVEIFDEPFASSAALSTAFVTGLAARRFKVMLSGEGGDELFGGYTWYRKWVRWYGREGRPVRFWHRPGNVVRKLLGRNYWSSDPLAGYANLMRAFSSKVMQGLFHPELLHHHVEAVDAGGFYRSLDNSSLAGFDRLQYLDMKLFLPAVCLRKVDRTSMSHSLEVRVPLLDRDIVELAGRVPENIRNPGAELKGLLKCIAREKLPEDLLTKRKQGFSTPISRWFPKETILSAIDKDIKQGDWWKPVFAPKPLAGAARLRGRSLWRFWHVWRWVKHRAMENHGLKVEYY